MSICNRSITASGPTRRAGTLAYPGIRLVAISATRKLRPHVAERVVASQFNAATVRQYTLMDVGIRYLALVEAEARRAAYQQSLQDIGEIERLTASHAKAGQGRDSDAKRASAEAAFVRADLVRMNEEIDVAAAELARLLDLDPSVRLRPDDPTPPLIELIDRRASLGELLEQTRANHPEIIARSADIDQQEFRLKQERVRPFLPTIALGFSAGGFGGGNSDFSPRIKDFGARTDLDLIAVWSLQNLGVGNSAVQNGRRAGLEMAYLDLTRTVDRIQQEGRAHAFAEAKRQEMEIGRKCVATAQRAYVLDLTRIGNIQCVPLEVLQSAKQLMDARQGLIRSMIAYSQAQLRLYAALGNTPR